MMRKEPVHTKLKMKDMIKIYKPGMSRSALQKAAKDKLGIDVGITSIVRTLKRMKEHGLLAVDKDNTIHENESYKGRTTTFYERDEDGKVSKIHHLKVDAKKEDTLDALRTAIDTIVEETTKPIKQLDNIPLKSSTLDRDNMVLYISNDVHLGALMWGEETGDRDWDLDIAESTFKAAIDNLVDRAPATSVCVVADLGDLTEIDDMKNMTPTSGHILDTDGRFPKIMKVALDCMKYFVEKALTKHATVYFTNISGNHDITMGYAIEAFMTAWFKNDDRVIIDDSPRKQKYFQFGSTLLGFAHGDGLRMKDAGEVMAMHNTAIWSNTEDRYYHFGHNHKDAVVEGRLCKAESHRNLAPLNAWASNAGFGRNAGTMKAIVYNKNTGEDGRITYKVRK